jgi:hypothetical protein
MAGRIFSKDLDSRLKAVEDRLAEVVGVLDRIAEHRRLSELAAQAVAQAAPAEPDEPQTQDKISRLEAIVCRLDERVEKITQTLVTQASRWA